MKTKILAVCLALCMIFTVVPASAFAKNNEVIPDILEEQMFDEGDEPVGEVSGNEDGDFSDALIPDWSKNELGIDEEEVSGNNRFSVSPSATEDSYMWGTEDSSAETYEVIGECAEVNMDEG